MAMVGRRKKVWRRGTTAVETAIVFPLLLLVTLGAIHYGWLFLKAQQITNAARIGVRMAIRPDVTVTDVQATIDSLFSPANANISGYTLSFFRSEVDAVTGLPLTDPNGNPTLTPIGDLVQDMGVPITVRISVPRVNVDFMNSAMLPTPDNLVASVTMAKEGF